jgi:hypothetical protein
MNTHRSTRVASLSLLTCLFACGSPPRADGTSTASTAESTSVVESASETSYVAIAEASDGYTLTTLGSGTATHVRTLVLSAVGIDATSLKKALATPGSVAARGTFRAPDEFALTALFRALPDIPLASHPAYYVARAESDGGDSATEVNLDHATPFATLDVAAALAPHVTEAWVAERVLDGSAIVAGDVASDTLHASAVFLRVPEHVTCGWHAGTCDAGDVATFERDASRCLVPTGCAHRAVCPLDIPECPSGYVRASWTGKDGCASFACDPAFDPAP